MLVVDKPDRQWHSHGKKPAAVVLIGLAVASCWGRQGCNQKACVCSSIRCLDRRSLGTRQEAAEVELTVFDMLLERRIGTALGRIER